MRRIGLIAFAALTLLTASCNRDRAEKASSDEHAGHTAGTTTTTSTTDTAEAPAISGGQAVQFGEGSGYLAIPATPGRKPGIIVIQEWWGVDEWVKQQTDRFSQQGYVALAVDLYRGRTAKSPEEAHELMRGLPEDRAIADLKAGIDHLSARPDVDPQHIGVIGWCMGGGYALKLASQDRRVIAVAANYGSVLTDTAAIARLNAQVLGNFGDADRGIPTEDVKKFGAALTAAGKLNDIKIYQGAGHAFMNPNNTEGYDVAAADDAGKRIDRFFSRTLRANIPTS